MRNAILSLSLLVSLFGCATQAPTPGGGSGPGGKEDSGWLSDQSFEIGATVKGVAEVEVSARGYEDVADSAEVQADLIDEQIRYAKNTVEGIDYRLNLVADEVEITNVETDGDLVRVHYTAVIDMIARLDDEAPTIDDLEHVEFTAGVPANPIGMTGRAGQTCTNGEHSAADYNYAYYFEASESCEVELTDLEFKVTEVFDRATAYPEYDQLMFELEDDGVIGFRAALVPASADRSPLDWHDGLKRMLEGLGAEGQLSEDESFSRYIIREGDTGIVVDLYDPTKNRFDAQFQEALGEYEFLYYLGHSNYGNQNLLNEPDAYSSRYQVITMHSCQSYAYYAQQVFRAKESSSDPQGWDAADVVATSPSTPAIGAAPSLEKLLTGMLEGINAVYERREEEAPTWLQIIERMNRADGYSQFGAAGVRENTWAP